MDSKIIKWHILNIGCISRNRFWSEDETFPHRKAVCTSTLIQVHGKNIIVDPSLPSKDMSAVLDARTGLNHEDIDFVFISHFHGDHLVDLGSFRNAIYFMNAEEMKKLQSTSQFSRDMVERFNPMKEEILEGIQTVSLPGHTEGLTGLMFNALEGKVILASDAIMNRDFFEAREGYFNTVDQEATKKTLSFIADTADIIIPGHDNYFINHRMQSAS